MKVGFLQFSPKFGEPKENLNFIKTKLKNSSINLLTLPELALTGYTFKDYEEAYSLSEEIGGNFTQELIKIAEENDIIIASGFLEKEGKSLYNSSVLLDKNGVIGVYRKIHLFYKEKNIFTPGNKGFPVFSIGDIRVGLLICFDWIFPESIRTLALKGADIVLHSANLVLPYYQTAILTRAIENRVFIVLANRIGREERFGQENVFIGGSKVVDPSGKVLLEISDKEEGLFGVNINPILARNKNITELNNIFEDRRPEFYYKD
ncbi:MAG: nitrilase-related carbon-nitrogen hydrolase [candidate division WOR-3 bacterium]